MIRAWRRAYQQYFYGYAATIGWFVMCDDRQPIMAVDTQNRVVGKRSRLRPDTIAGLEADPRFSGRAQMYSGWSISL